MSARGIGMGPGVSRRVPARMGASVLPPMVPACVDLGGQDCSVNQPVPQGDMGPTVS